MKLPHWFSWGVSVLVLLAHVGCSTTALETVKVPGVGPAWEMASMKDFGSGKGAITELVPVGQSIGNWTHLLTIQFLEGIPLRLEECMDARRAQIAARCPDVIWNVLSHDQYGITYEWRIERCPGRADQHELVRLLRGNDGLHRVSYAEKIARMEPKSRALWLSRLNNTLVIKGDAMESVVVEQAP